jgi:hypothetical protein
MAQVNDADTTKLRVQKGPVSRTRRSWLVPQTIDNQS